MRFLPKRGPKVWQWFIAQTILIVAAWIFGMHSSGGDVRGLSILGVGLFVSIIYAAEHEKGIGNSAFVVFMLCMLFDGLLNNIAFFVFASMVFIFANMKDAILKVRVWWHDPVWGRSQLSEELEKEAKEQLEKIRADMKAENRHCDTKDPF